MNHERWDVQDRRCLVELCVKEHDSIRVYLLSQLDGKRRPGVLGDDHQVFINIEPPRTTEKPDGGTNIIGTSIVKREPCEAGPIQNLEQLSKVGRLVTLATVDEYCYWAL